MKLLLIYPNARRELIGLGDLGAIAEPLALEYLAAGAKTDGHDVKLLDLRLHPGELDQTVLAYEPDVVGVTGYSMHVLRNLAICCRVKELCPGCKTVVGGHHATLLPEDFFEPQVDFVVVGEGAAPLRGILAAIENGHRALSIPGVWTFVGPNHLYGGPPGELHLDEIPVPDRTAAREDRPSYFIDWMKPVALIRTTVGCPYRCTFCSLWRIMDGRYHTRELDRIVDELATIPEDFVFLVDDEPFVNGPRMKELARKIKAAGIRKRYFAYCRIDTLLREREMITAWRSIGLERLFIGIEAITEDELTDYRKKLTVAQISDGLERARELGIKVFAGFIVNPDYSRQDFKRLVRFIEHHRIDYPSFTILTPLPGTPALSNFDHILPRQPNGRPRWDLFDLQEAVVKTRLPLPEFMEEYHHLREVFAGRYTQYRELGSFPRKPKGEPVPLAPV
jgi:radical SAM superfamily enzyme YgiQ (UPF0313 family)